MMIRIEVSTFLKEVQAVAYRSFSRGAPGSFLRHISARSPGARGAKKSPSHHHPNNVHQRLNTTINAPRPPATVRLLVRLKQHRSFVQRNSSWSKRLVANLVARSSSHRLVTGGRPPNPSEENQDSASTLSSSSLSINSSQSSQSSWWEQAQSLPNLITISRIASAPVLGYYIATEQTQYALILCGLAGLSDWLDGHIARRYNLATKLGSYLDPLGDKVVINVVAVSLLWTPAALPVPVVTLWLTKDLLLMAGTAWWLHHTVSEPALIQATNISKINTGLQFATLAVAIGGQTEMAFWTNLSTTWLLPLCYVTSGTTVASIFSYRHQMAFPGLSAGLVCHQR